MTPRKELYIAIKNKLSDIEGMEYVALHRNQMSKDKENMPNLFTACLIRINRVNWENMTDRKRQEGKTTVDIVFYNNDGFATQWERTMNDEEGLKEIDLIDQISDALQFMSGEQFSKLEQISDEPDELSEDVLMSYTLSFSTCLYREITTYPYTYRKASLTKL